MNNVFNEYQKRKVEIETCFVAAEQLYNKREEHDSFENLKFYDEDFIKILKSNILLMIYNLIESSVLGSIIAIYNNLKNQQLSFHNVSKEIQDIWITFRLNEVYDRNASHTSYNRKTNQIIKEILESETIILTRKATGISGNLDAQNIITLCQEHGIPFAVPANCRGGFVLKDIKNERNALAHGEKTFAECGRDYSIADLRLFSKDTNTFIEAFLSNIQQYYDSEQFKTNQG